MESISSIYNNINKLLDSSKDHISLDNDDKLHRIGNFFEQNIEDNNADADDIKKELHQCLISVKEDGKRKYVEHAKRSIYRISVDIPTPDFIIYDRDLPPTLRKKLDSLSEPELDSVLREVLQLIFELIDKDYFWKSIYRNNLLQWRFEQQTIIHSIDDNIVNTDKSENIIKSSSDINHTDTNKTLGKKSIDNSFLKEEVSKYTTIIKKENENGHITRKKEVSFHKYRKGILLDESISFNSILTILPIENGNPISNDKIKSDARILKPLDKTSYPSKENNHSCIGKKDFLNMESTGDLGTVKVQQATELANEQKIRKI